jgi:hypothetical protein
LQARQLSIDAAPFLSRFGTKIRVERSGCWVWVGAITKSTGYGKVKLNGRPKDAHRASYEMHIGPVPAGLEIDHLCRNRPCVNPAHMEPVTRGENTRRGDHYQRRKTHCPQGHPYTGQNIAYRMRDGGLTRQCRTCRLQYDRRRDRSHEAWALRRKAARRAAHNMVLREEPEPEREEAAV